MAKLNTHYYDGQLHNAFLETLLNPIHNLSKNTKATAFSKLKHKLNQSAAFDQEARKNYNIVVHDFHYQNHKNYDHTNNLWADDLLYLLSEYIHSFRDLLDLLAVQFKEMTNGLCPQGRTHRLYQLALAFINK